MNASSRSLRPIGVDLVLLKEIAPRIGVSVGALYQAACRKELQLIRLGESWAVDLQEVQTFAKVYRDRREMRAAEKAQRSAKRAMRAASTALRTARARRGTT